jgi:cbb3-type cytochrome oxidase subunit 3
LCKSWFIVLISLLLLSILYILYNIDIMPYF